METFRQFVLGLLPVLARLHPKNHNIQRTGYPQLWYCWPRWMGRRNPRLFHIRTWFCGALTGHEISRTEWGYGGGAFVDLNCRWCDKTIKVPALESHVPEALKECVLELGNSVYANNTPDTE